MSETTPVADEPLNTAAEVLFAAAVAECKASRFERRIHTLWIQAEFDCGPEASEGKAAMRKIAYEQARQKSVAAGRALLKALELWRQLGGKFTEGENDAWLRRVMAEAGDGS